MKVTNKTLQYLSKTNKVERLLFSCSFFHRNRTSIHRWSSYFLELRRWKEPLKNLVKCKGYFVKFFQNHFSRILFFIIWYFIGLKFPSFLEVGLSVSPKRATMYWCYTVKNAKNSLLCNNSESPMGKNANICFNDIDIPTSEKNMI